MDAETRRIERRLGTASWGAFLFWLGASFVIGLNWGIALIGVAVVILLTQAIRLSLKLGVESLWVAVAVMFAGAGLWDLYEIQVPFVPLVLIAAGAALLLAAILGGRRRRHQH